MGGLHEDGNGRVMEKGTEGYDGVETVGEDDSETGSLTKKKRRLKSTAGIGVSLTPDFRLNVTATTTVSTSGFTDYTFDGIV